MKKYFLKIGIVFLLLFPLMILGTFYDFEITYELSQVYYKDGSYVYTPPIWVIPVEIISEIPAMILFAISSTLAYNYIIKCLGKNIRYKCFSGIMITISVFSIFRLGQTLTMGITNNYELSYIWYIGIAIISILVFFLLNLNLKKVNVDKLKAMYGVVMITICAGIVVLGVTGVIKYTWGRPRLRNLIDEGSMQGYLPWYKPMLFSGYTSFPSGHSAKAGYMFILSLWFENNVKVQRIMNMFTWIYVLIVCGARLMQAEHYLTDVVFGTFITYVIVEMFKCLFYSEWMKKYREKSKS